MEKGAPQRFQFGLQTAILTMVLAACFIGAIIKCHQTGYLWQFLEGINLLLTAFGMRLNHSLYAKMKNSLTPDAPPINHGFWPKHEAFLTEEGRHYRDQLWKCSLCLFLSLILHVVLLLKIDI